MSMPISNAVIIEKSIRSKNCFLPAIMPLRGCKAGKTWIKMVSKGLATSQYHYLISVNVFTKSAVCQSGWLIARNIFRGRDLYRHLGIRSAHSSRALIPSFIEMPLPLSLLWMTTWHHAMRQWQRVIIFGCVVYYDHLAYVWVCVTKCDYWRQWFSLHSMLV